MKKKIIFLICLSVLTACSTKRDSFKNRTFHSTTAWFNTLFNAEKEMDKKIDELEFNYRDNYAEILPVDPRPEVKDAFLDEEDFLTEPAGPRPGKGSSGSTQPAATGFDLVEKKAMKAIEKHSMLIKGKERNKEMTHAYLLLGKARYNKGKGFEALEALNYVQNRLPYSKKYTPQAKLYSALANIQVGNDIEGQKILSNMYKDGGYKRKMTENISKYYAEYLIGSKQYEDAIPVLDQTIAKTKNKKRRARYYFIEAQLYSLLGDQINAGQTFTKVFKMKPGFEMEVKSQLGIAANFDPEKNSYNSYKDHLLNVSKSGNYLSRKNEFYYAIGDMAIKANKIDDARKYLQESFKGTPSDPYIRGLAYEKYANLEFDEGNYVHASAYYDSALAVAPFQKDLDRITKRSESLKFLMQKYYLVKKNDSILKVAYMRPEEKEKFFGDYIAKLKSEDAKKQKQSEQEATIFQAQTKGSNFDSSFDGGNGGGGTFYFYNTGLKSQGQNDFKRIWGNIKLADNWRISTGAGSQSLEEKEAELLGKTESQNPRRYELDFYLEQIPTELSELNTLKIQRDTAELSLGIGYYELFKNSKIATKTLEHLVSTPPKEQSTEAQAYYQLYRINNKSGEATKAEEYKNMILSKYPNSIYAQYILNPDVSFITPTTQEALDYYEETYLLYKDGDYAEVKKRAQIAIEKYPTEIIIAKFALLNALSIGKTEGKEQFINALELITVAYQNTEEAKKAQEILDLLNGVKKEKEKEAGNDKKSQNKGNEDGGKETQSESSQNLNTPNQKQNINPSQRPQPEIRKQEAQQQDKSGKRQGPGKPGGR